MTTRLAPPLTLEDFLKLPHIEDSPAWEYVDGVAIQKPLPKVRHSILQKRLVAEVDGSTTSYTALPELRCTFAGRSIVPDIAVIAWDRTRLSETGEPEDNFTAAPDWIIEMLSPGQRVSRVIDNILHCLKHGSKLGWMVDLDDYSVLIFAPQQEPEICRADRQLKVIDGIQLALTPQQIFVLQYTTPAAWP